MAANRPRADIRAWRPPVPGIAEVFHAHFTEHAYPVHTHDTWDLMILDDGSVDFFLDRRPHGVAGASAVMLLPPGVPHDGRTATAAGFRKRVLYLDTSVLPARLTGSSVDAPVFDDGPLRHRIHQLHTSLGRPGEEFEAESRLSFIRERLYWHLDARPGDPAPPDPGRRDAGLLAARLRELLDAHVASGLSLGEAAGVLHAHPAHLIRSFKRAYGLPPHTYLTGKRIERARGLLLDGRPAASVATAAGFYDQAHLNRHFTRHVGTTPARYAVSRGA